MAWVCEGRSQPGDVAGQGACVVVLEPLEDHVDALRLLPEWQGLFTAEESLGFVEGGQLLHPLLDERVVVAQVSPADALC